MPVAGSIAVGYRARPGWLRCSPWSAWGTRVGNYMDDAGQQESPGGNMSSRANCQGYGWSRIGLARVVHPVLLNVLNDTVRRNGIVPCSPARDNLDPSFVLTGIPLGI